MTSAPDKRPWYGWLLRGLFVLSGLFPLLGLFGDPPDTMLLIYTLFVAAYFLRHPLQLLDQKIPGPAWAHTLAWILIAGWITETLAWTNNYLKKAPEPALFHPQLFADLIIAIGFYGGWAVAWLIAFRFYRYTLAETFLVTGIQGIFFEQLGAIFVMMVQKIISNPAFAVLIGVYVCLVHGSALSLGMVPALHRYQSPDKSRHWSRILVASLLMVGCAFAGCWLVAQFCRLFGGLPSKRSIVEYPLW